MQALRKTHDIRLINIKLKNQEVYSFAMFTNAEKACGSNIAS